MARICFWPANFSSSVSAKRGGALGLLDLAIKILDLPLQGDLQVVGPVVQLVGFRLEKPGVALGNSLANHCLAARHLVAKPRIGRGLGRLRDGGRRQREHSPGRFFGNHLSIVREAATKR